MARQSFVAVARISEAICGTSKTPDVAAPIRATMAGLIEERAQPFDVLKGEAGLPDPARRRPRKLLRRTPARDPVLYLVERHGGAGLSEIIQPTPVLGDGGADDIDHGIEQRHGLSEHGGDILPALVGHLAQPRIGVGVDIQSAANGVHEMRINAEEDFVEARGLGDR